MARLVVLNPSLHGVTHELGGKWTTIGRADGNTFQLLEGSVSGWHCEVRLRGDELVVRDLLSMNGTFVGGRKISEAVLQPGQTLRLGDVELRFEGSGPSVLSGAPFNSKMLVASFSASKPAVVPETPPAAASAPEPAPAAEAGRKFQVLLVDDSMAFLESFAGLCAEWSNRRWQIHTVTSADRALARLQEQPVDLVVLDIGMPLLDGLQLLRIIHRRHPGLKTAVLTGGATEARRADALANGAEMFLEKPVTPEGMKMIFNVLNDLVSWPGEGGVGALRRVGLSEAIQMECNGRHSSILEIRNPELCGQIYIEAGVITHAAAGELAGEQAFCRLLSLRGGGFEIHPFQAPPQRTIQTRWEQLLMEAARAKDEETVLVKNPASEPPTAPAPAPKPTEDIVDHGLGDQIVVVSTYDGKWSPHDQTQGGNANK